MCHDLLLDQYAKELGVPISLEELIDSHRYLRAKNKQSSEKINKQIQTTVQNMVQQRKGHKLVEWKEFIYQLQKQLKRVELIGLERIR